MTSSLSEIEVPVARSLVEVAADSAEDDAEVEVGAPPAVYLLEMRAGAHSLLKNFTPTSPDEAYVSTRAAVCAAW